MVNKMDVQASYEWHNQASHTVLQSCVSVLLDLPSTETRESKFIEYSSSGSGQVNS